MYLYIYFFLLSPVSDFVWQWKDEKRRWNAYGPSDTIALENGRQNNDDTVSLMVAGRNYTINLNDMEQCNDETDVVREVERLKTGTDNVQEMYVCR